MTSRRVFLKGGAAALVTMSFAPDFLVRTASAQGRRGKVLVAVFQRGAMDGLSAVIPFGEAAYYAARPSIAIGKPGRADSALDLNGFFGLHPRLAPLHAWFTRGQLAFVHACGSPDATRSHFDAQDYMESGTPGVKSTTDGWLNRYLHAKEHQDASPFRAVALSPQLPRMLQGGAPALAMSDITRFGIVGSGRSTPPAQAAATSFETQYAEAADIVMNRTGREAFDAIRRLREADPTHYAPERGVVYPRSPFGDALRQIAQLIKADVGLEIAFAESGNWDHHVNQGGATGQLATRLDDLARTLSAFATDLGERLADVLVLTMSEFGRSVRENGNRGTDHGHGNVMMALGGAVDGGRVCGRWPGLGDGQRFEGRDLAVTTDFRDVFAEVAVRHLGLLNPGELFPGHAVNQGRFPGIFRV